MISLIMKAWLPNHLNSIRHEIEICFHMMQMNSELIILCHLHLGNCSIATEIYTCYQLNSSMIAQRPCLCHQLECSQCCHYMQPHGVLTVYTTGQSDIFFGFRDLSHIFQVLKKYAYFWRFTNIQAKLFGAISGSENSIVPFSAPCEHKRG